MNIKRSLAVTVMAATLTFNSAQAHAVLPFVFVAHSSGSAILSGAKGYIAGTLIRKPFARFLLPK